MIHRKCYILTKFPHLAFKNPEFPQGTFKKESHLLKFETLMLLFICTQLTISKKSKKTQGDCPSQPTVLFTNVNHRHSSQNQAVQGAYENTSAQSHLGSLLDYMFPLKAIFFSLLQKQYLYYKSLPTQSLSNALKLQEKSCEQRTENLSTVVQFKIFPSGIDSKI